MASSQAHPTRGKAKPPDGIAVELLLEAGVALASSLDFVTTMEQVARLTVPRLADLCVIDLLEEDGTVRKVAAVSALPGIAEGLEELRSRFPIDPRGEHPVALVLDSGEPMLLENMSAGKLTSFAESSEHARFMIANGYHSAVVAPLLARGRTLGALSLLRLGDSPAYDPDDLELGSELARRAALALDNASLFAAVRSVERRLEAILANLAEAITVVDESGRTVYANRAAADLLGVGDSEDLIGAEPGTTMARFLVFDESGRELSLADMPGRRLFEGVPPEPLVVRNVVRATGEERWLVIRSSAVTDPDSGRVLYAVNVFENITEVKRAQLAESFMVQASRVLATTMDHAETLRRIAALTVPRIADWCAIDLLDDRGRIVRAAVHHGDPARMWIAEELDRGYRPSLHEPTGVGEVIRTGEARVYNDIDPDALASYAKDDEHLRLLREIGATAVIIAPLAAPSRTVGAITLISAESKRRYSEADLGLAVRLGRRAGTAVESSRLYTERTRIAKVLEAALLPETLPSIPGVELHAVYQAAGELNDVGGDFYDAFPYGDGRWMVLIGDVCGKGARAAGVTALARHTLRTAAMLGQDPAGMIATLHEALRNQPTGADLCTACLIALEPDRARARLTVTLAGHPPPLVIDGDGARAIGEPGTVLGVIDPIAITEVSAQLDAGQTLLLYTDGLTDADRTSQLSEEDDIVELWQDAADAPLPLLLQRMVGAASARAEESLRDDIALVALRVSA